MTLASLANKQTDTVRAALLIIHSDKESFGSKCGEFVLWSRTNYQRLTLKVPFGFIHVLAWGYTVDV